MAQPQRSGSAPADKCLRCPECQYSLTVTTVTTNRGAYCRCDRCGHIWHQDDGE